MPKQALPRIRETDLYAPLYDFFTAQGFRVNGEVNHCDLVATRGTELVIVELKSSFNAKLLIQAAKRQGLTDLVYIAIPKPKGNLRRRSWQDLCHLVSRLGLGMLLVDLRQQPATVEVVCEPVPFDRTENQRRRKKKTKYLLLNEVSKRHGDYNVGGSNRCKLMTAYKENAFQIACYLERLGPLSPSSLQKLGTGGKTPSILQKNFYGWFERITRGVYQLTPSAREFLCQYPELLEFYRQKLAATDNNLESKG
ncbi:MAG TPA: DUF2161 family putative PD-(D/E)XK-type phosphodiesterase [Bacillota bacterium]